MKYLIKTILAFSIIFSCNSQIEDTSFCNNDNFSLSKNIIGSWDKSHKEALSDLTSILNGYNGTSMIFNERFMYTNITYELFFNITDNEQNLYLVESTYKDISTENGSTELFLDRTKKEFLQYKIITEIPINQLSKEKISTFSYEYKGNPRVGNYGMNITVESLYSYEPFQKKVLYFKNGNLTKIGECEPTSDFIIITDKAQGEILYKYLKDFANKFNP